MKTTLNTPIQFRTTKVKFIKEWTPTQFKLMEKAIVKHFHNKKIRTLHGYYLAPLTFRQLDAIFGLAYTSSGMWACYGVCNTNVWFDEDNIYRYDYFTIGEDGNFYAVLTDNDENELTIKL